MVIFKVEVTIKKTREEEWIKWMTEKHIPDVLNTGHFFDYSFRKLLKNGKVIEQDKSIFEIEYLCRNDEALDAYENNDAPRLRSEHARLYENDVNVYRTRSTYLDLSIPKSLELGM